MDVLIKNMEMPKERIMLEIFPNGRVFEINPHNNARIPTEAEAIELPPHGDLKDANELEKAAEKMAVCDSYEYTIAHEMIKKLLEIAPTVLEAST